jgi:hypothetical protein
MEDNIIARLKMAICKISQKYPFPFISAEFISLDI